MSKLGVLQTYTKGKTYMAGVVPIQEMIDVELGFDCDQCSFPNCKWYPPWLNEHLGFIQYWLLDEPASR